MSDIDTLINDMILFAVSLPYDEDTVYSRINKFINLHRKQLDNIHINNKIQLPTVDIDNNAKQSIQSNITPKLRFAHGHENEQLYDKLHQSNQNYLIDEDEFRVSDEQRKKEDELVKSLGGTVYYLSEPFDDGMHINNLVFPLKNVGRDCVETSPIADFQITLNDPSSILSDKDHLNPQIISAVIDTGADVSAGPYINILELARTFTKGSSLIICHSKDSLLDRAYISGYIAFNNDIHFFPVVLIGERRLTEWVIGRQGFLNNCVYVWIGSNIIKYTIPECNNKPGLYFSDNVVFENNIYENPDTILQKLKKSLDDLKSKEEVKDVEDINNKKINEARERYLKRKQDK